MSRDEYSWQTLRTRYIDWETLNEYLFETIGLDEYGYAAYDIRVSAIGPQILCGRVLISLRRRIRR
jgi:hypothetical protein